MAFLAQPLPKSALLPRPCCRRRALRCAAADNKPANPFQMPGLGDITKMGARRVVLCGLRSRVWSRGDDAAGSFASGQRAWRGARLTRRTDAESPGGDARGDVEDAGVEPRRWAAPPPLIRGAFAG